MSPLEWKYCILAYVHLSSHIKYYYLGAGTSIYTLFHLLQCFMEVAVQAPHLCLVVNCKAAAEKLRERLNLPQLPLSVKVRKYS